MTHRSPTAHAAPRRAATPAKRFPRVAAKERLDHAEGSGTWQSSAGGKVIGQGIDSRRERAVELGKQDGLEETGAAVRMNRGKMNFFNTYSKHLALLRGKRAKVRVWRFF